MNQGLWIGGGIQWKIFLTLDSPCDNKKITIITLPVRIPNGEIITSTYTELLSKTDLPVEARKADIFPCLKKALLSIEKNCYHGCQAVFDNNKVLILNKSNRKIMMRGRRDPL